MMAVEQNKLRGVLLNNEAMARHTSWRVGGPADRFYKPLDIDDLVEFLCQLPEQEPVYWLGLGSNLLVRDGGIRGTVICTSGVLNGLEVLSDGRVRAEAGVSCAKVARFCAQHGFKHAEFLGGIPGTMGGALAMNAGAFGGETWNLIDQVETIDHRGTRSMRTPDEYQIGYRHVRGPENEWFLAGYLKLEKGEDRAGRAHIKKLLARRNATQPTQQPSAGSTFRNPPGDYSARLIEAAGLKGFCIGKACVSEKHANFIINTGGTSAADIEQLIAHVAQTVKKVHGVELVTEVHVIGEPVK
jgi:UDP-N-acetylmuramate dehydrogenase